MISVIVTTYNRPGHLRLSLDAVSRQFLQPDEIIVADDGSSEETRKTIEQFAASSGLTVIHVRQEHKGFRAARSRNNALRLAQGDFIAFLDQDGLADHDWLEKHFELHKPGKFNIGALIMLDEKPSSEISTENILSGEYEEMHSRKEENRIRRLQRKSSFYAFLRRIGLGIKNKPRLDSGNFAIHKSDIEKVNGFDENFVGWGQEDDDLGRRLYLAGIMPNPVIDAARVSHIWHERDMSASGKWTEGKNIGYFARKRVDAYCKNGIRNPEGAGEEPVIITRYNST